MSSPIDKKIFKIVLFCFILAEILSYFGWLNYWVNTICFIVIILATVILSLRKLEYGLYILFAELFVGSKGYLFSLNLGGTILSIRMGIFLVVMGVWVTHELLRIIKRINANKILEGDCHQKVCHSCESRNPSVIHEIPAGVYPALRCGAGMTKKEVGMTKHILLLAVVVFWAFVWGMIRGNDFGNVFLDFNNWLYFLLIFPVMSVIARPPLAPPYKGGDDRDVFFKNIISLMMAAVLVVALKTIGLFYLFSHNFISVGSEIYKWVRDTGVGEITNMGGGFYRVFIQSQIYSLLAFFILFFGFCHPGRAKSYNSMMKPKDPMENYKKSFLDPHFREDDKEKTVFTYYLLLITTFATIILSFSRSYWLAIAITLFFYFVVLFLKLQIIRPRRIRLGRTDYRLQITFYSFSKLMAVAMISFGLIATLLYLPPKIVNLDWAAVFGKRATQGEAASSSRINQLNPLLLAISKHPFIGSGFGTTVTYQSNDLRIVNETAGRSGLITTYAFEWGYLDMVLKFGLVGIFVYLYFIFKILCNLRNVKCQMSNDQNSKNYSLSPYGRSPEGRLITHYSLQSGFALALIALLIVNIFSPYLNHPLGIGFVILSFAFTCPEQSRRMF